MAHSCFHKVSRAPALDDSYSYRSTVCVYGGKYFIPVRRSNQEAAGVKPGDALVAGIVLDKETRKVEPPSGLKAAFAKYGGLRANWEKLSYTAKKEHADAILQAKKTETRARRVEKILDQLKG